MESEITATRNGITRTFPANVWRLMGKGNCGWERVIPAPAVVQETLNKEDHAESPEQENGKSQHRKPRKSR